MLENIRRICKERDLSILRLEREAGLAAHTMCRWDKNIPSVDKVKRVADALGVTVDDLLRKENSHDN